MLNNRAARAAVESREWRVASRADRFIDRIRNASFSFEPDGLGQGQSGSQIVAVAGRTRVRCIIEPN